MISDYQQYYLSAMSDDQNLHDISSVHLTLLCTTIIIPLLCCILPLVFNVDQTQ